MFRHVWVVAYSYGMRRHDNQRFLFDENDLKVVGGMLEEQSKPQPQWDRKTELSEFTCIGAAKVQLGHVSGPFTTWSKEELILRRYCRRPNDFCTLDVIDFYPCCSTWSIATRQGMKAGRGGGELRRLTFKNCQPLFVAGTDLSEVEV